MCYGEPSPSFPSPDCQDEISAEVESLVFGKANTSSSIVIIPDIYGTSAFYQGLSTLLAQKGARVYLVNPFAGLGDLKEGTREEAFARRHKVHDKAFVDQVEAFCESQKVDSVIGFCLGGYYIFELARRNVAANLVGFYGFPQGMDNIDPLPKPFDYLDSVSKQQLCLMPGQDMAVGIDNVERLAQMAQGNDALQLHVYQESGHTFLKDLDSDDEQLRNNALDALAKCERAVGL